MRSSDTSSFGEALFLVPWQQLFFSHVVKQLEEGRERERERGGWCVGGNPGALSIQDGEEMVRHKARNGLCEVGPATYSGPPCALRPKKAAGPQGPVLSLVLPPLFSGSLAPSVHVSVFLGVYLARELAGTPGV